MAGHVSEHAAGVCYPSALVNRVRTARGHLDGVLRMMESGAYCPDVMKQLAAVGGLLDGTTRLVLRMHLETCVADRVRTGDHDRLIDQLMEALKYGKHVTSVDNEGGSTAKRSQP